MTAPKKKALLLGWSARIPSSNVQDPLGLSLRASSRLGNLLLYCITSATPRARYFSFIPWCVFDHRHQQKGRPAVRDAVILREKALALACVAHHRPDKGGTCKGGAVVGTIEAKRWLRQEKKTADLKSLKFTENPALDSYFTSLKNLGCFAQLPASEDDSEEAQVSWDDLELSPLGLRLAQGYAAVVGRLPAVCAIRSDKHACAVDLLADLGKHGGLCELTATGAQDRTLLRDIFFGITGLTDDSHARRRGSLLLILELCRQFGPGEWSMDEENFSSAVYYRELKHEADGKSYRLSIDLPPALGDIANRWRMFYFHHYMSVALEGLFCWLVTNLVPHRLVGASLETLVAQ